jgi:sigma-B regulation protein RsbU (phosphoserine phosphatase)
MFTPPGSPEKLRRLLDVTLRMAATTDLTELLGTIVDATCEVLDCERATIFLYKPESEELCSHVATGVDSICFPADAGIAGAAAQQRTVINVPEAYRDPRFNREIDRQTGFVTRNLLTFPLENLTGELMGVLQALNKCGGPFRPEDEELARVLSAQAGVALHRYALLEQYAEKQRMGRELEIARHIQQQTFPKTSPRLAGYDIAGWNRSAEETGGDCYDFITLEDGRVGVVLADATGHGVGAALVIAECRSLARALLGVTQDVSTVAERMNELLMHDLAPGCFVTALVGVLDPRQNRLDFVSAGQAPLLVVSDAGSQSRPASGLPFAIQADTPYPAEKIDFAHGTMLILLTDGFYETSAPDDDLFGEDRVIDYVRNNADMPLDALISGLHDQLKRFSEGTPQRDDLTAVVIRRRR